MEPKTNPSGRGPAAADVTKNLTYLNHAQLFIAIEPQKPLERIPIGVCKEIIVAYCDVSAGWGATHFFQDAHLASIPIARFLVFTHHVVTSTLQSVVTIHAQPNFFCGFYVR